jgi:hypothetical protein
MISKGNNRSQYLEAGRPPARLAAVRGPIRLGGASSMSANRNLNNYVVRVARDGNGADTRFGQKPPLGMYNGHPDRPFATPKQRWT